jgi:D-sedoheptulose 7-phosphate isomerase
MHKPGDRRQSIDWRQSMTTVDFTLDSYLSAEADLLRRLPRQPIAQIVAILRQARQDGRRIFIFGNGGSAATASHFAVDMVKGTLNPAMPRFKVICLNDNVPTLTALGNDIGYDRVFVEPLLSLAEPGDVAVAVSGSGNSPNVIAAMKAARQAGLTTIGLSGESGGQLKELVDVAVLAPSASMQLIEDAHLVILHAVFVELCR